MKTVFSFALVGFISTGFTVTANAQSVLPPVQPASAPAPASAASDPSSNRSTAVKAAENANEPGRLRPEQRVIPQISIPLTRGNDALPASPIAPLPGVGVPGAVNDSAARCSATRDSKDKAACEPTVSASGPLNIRK